MMNLSLRARLFIFFSILVLLILAIVLLILASRKPTTPEAQIPTQGQLPGGTGVTPSGGVSVPEVPAGPQIKPLSDLETQQNAARQVAKIFAERYGSYSTDSNFENIRELEVLSTSRLWSSLSKQIKTSSAGSGFVGVTTKVFSSEIADWKTDSAQITIMAIRNETKNNATTQTRVSAKVGAVKSGDKWLVLDFAWQK